MATTDTTPTDQIDDELLTDQPDDSPVIRELRRQAREDRKARTAAEAEAERVKGESAKQTRERQVQDGIAKLGIPDADRDRFRQLVDKMIDGDATEEAMRKLADDYRFTPGIDPTAADEAARMENAAGAHQGATVPVAGSEAEQRRIVSEFRDKAMTAPLGALAGEQAALVRYLEQNGSTEAAAVMGGGQFEFPTPT